MAKRNPPSAYLRELRRRHKRGAPRKIDSNPALRAFVRHKLPVMTFLELREACVAKFGEEKSPSRSTIHRYWQLRVKKRPRTPRNPPL